MASNTFLFRAASVATRNRSNSQTSFRSHISNNSNRQRAISHGEITGDTFTLLKDALRLQRNLEKTIGGFKLSRGLCKELSEQIESCDRFVNDLLADYEVKKPVLESQGYFAAVIEYVEVINKASEFVLLLKDKGAITRLKNRDRYRKATRVLGLEVGKAIHHLQRLLLAVCPDVSNETTFVDNPTQTMATITGTLKLLRNRVFAESEQLNELQLLKENSESQSSKGHRIQRRQIRRLLDHTPRLGNGFVVYKANYNGIIVSEKVFKDISATVLREVQQEIARWLQLRPQPRVAWIHGLWIEGSSLGVISDYFDKGNLHQLLSKLYDAGSQLDLDHQLRFTTEIIEMIHNIHQEKMPLGGLHLREIFLNQDSSLQLSNFESLLHRVVGNYRDEYLFYTPPEYRQTNTEIVPTLEGDIYGLGIVLRSIWSTQTPSELAVASSDDFFNNSWPETMSPGFSSLIEKCGASDPKLRPTSSELLSALQSAFPSSPLNYIQVTPELTREHSADLSVITQLSLSPGTQYNTLDTLSSTLLDSTKNLSFSTPKESGLSPKLEPQSISDDEYFYPLLRQPSIITLSSNNTSSVSGTTEDDIASNLGISLKDALYLYSSEQYEKAYSYFMYLSEVEGCPAAKYYLGVYHYSGKAGFLSRDIPKALNYLQKAAEDDYGDALDLLGLHHLDSTYGTPDFEKAFEYFERAASLLSPAGCYHLSQCHQNGHGTTPDPDLAFYALQLSASLGYGPAVAMLEQELAPLS